VGWALRSVGVSAVVSVDARSQPGAWSARSEGDRFTSLSTSLPQLSAANSAEQRRMKNFTWRCRPHSATHSFGDACMAVDHG
jgi:hypothetical protein